RHPGRDDRGRGWVGRRPGTQRDPRTGAGDRRAGGDEQLSQRDDAPSAAGGSPPTPRTTGAWRADEPRAWIANRAGSRLARFRFMVFMAPPPPLPGKRTDCQALPSNAQKPFVTPTPWAKEGYCLAQGFATSREAV